jgi:excisionase family DNA binding protein
MEPGRLLRISEVAERLGVHDRTVRRLINTGEIAAVKLGHGKRSPIRVPADELEAWLYAAPDESEEEN